YARDRSIESPHLKILFITYLPVELLCELPSISSLPVIGFIAKSKRYRTCDIAFEHFHSSHLSFLLLTKAIIVFMAGEHPDAISRLDDLIAATRPCTTCYHANIATDVFLETRRWNVMTTRVQCIRSRARAQTQGDVGPPLFAISLISGWEFDLLDILIRQRLCEALYALGRTMELLWTKKSTSGFLVSSVLFHSFPAHSGFHGDPPILHANFNLQTPIPLLREWEKATLFVVPRFTTYVALCERLETIERITDAVECFYDMTSELGGDVNP
ncbi:hypothetical protein EV363DRAFT_1374840, partial [Boletus edulis]